MPLDKQAKKKKEKEKEKTIQMSTTILTQVINPIYQRKIDLLIHKRITEKYF